MKKKTLELNNFNGSRAQRKEFIMSRKKHLKEIEPSETVWTSSNPVDSRDFVIFPISADIIVCRRYEDDQQWSYSITRIQNGKDIPICKDKEYIEYSDVDYEKFFAEFNSIVESFEKRGFEKISA